MSKNFTVIVPEGNGYSDPEAVSRITDHFQQLALNAEFVSENNLPVQDDHGAYTLVTNDAKAEKLAPTILDSHYGLMAVAD